MGNVLRLGIARVGLAINQWRANRKIQKKTIVILILGLQGVGKSTIALRLWKLRKSLPEGTYVQTKGFNTYEIKKRNHLTIKINDLGGHESVRELWSHYYADAHGVIFVVDSSKPEDLPEAGEILADVLRDERIMRKPVLVLANKQDDPRAVSEVDLTRSMDLVTTVNSVRCLTRVDLCAANNLKMDEGIFVGFKWLVNYIETHYGEINTRVLHDSMIEREREKARFNMLRDQTRRLREQDEANSINTESSNSARRKPTEIAAETDPHENGIDQIQPPILCAQSVDEENLVAVGEVQPPMPPVPAAFKANQEETIPERPSPEGAADSAEELNKYTEPKVTVVAEKPSNHNISTKVEETMEGGEKKDSRPSSKVSKNNNFSAKKSKEGATTAGVKGRQKTGSENLAFEASEDDRESVKHQMAVQNNHIRYNSSDFHRLMRYRANSIRSNSTETDVEVPGEIILVTTRAEVHESQEMLDDMMDVNSNPKNGSPTFSMLSGHISHKTSMESINFSLGNDLDSISNSAALGKNRSRSSSTGKLDVISVPSARSNKEPSTLQKLSNLKNRNKTAPLSDNGKDGASTAHHNHANGTALSARSQKSGGL